MLFWALHCHNVQRPNVSFRMLCITCDVLIDLTLQCWSTCLHCGVRGAMDEGTFCLPLPWRGRLWDHPHITYKQVIFSNPSPLLHPVHFLAPPMLIYSLTSPPPSCFKHWLLAMVTRCMVDMTVVAAKKSKQYAETGDQFSWHIACPRESNCVQI